MVFSTLKLPVIPPWKGPTHQPEGQPPSDQPCFPALRAGITTPLSSSRHWARVKWPAQDFQDGLYSSETQVSLPPAVVMGHRPAVCGRGREAQSEREIDLQFLTAGGGRAAETHNPPSRERACEPRSSSAPRTAPGSRCLGHGPKCLSLVQTHKRCPHQQDSCPFLSLRS